MGDLGEEPRAIEDDQDVEEDHDDKVEDYFDQPEKGKDKTEIGGSSDDDIPADDSEKHEWAPIFNMEDPDGNPIHPERPVGLNLRNTGFTGK